MTEPKIIEGDFFSDERGVLQFCNDYNMKEVMRFYMVENKSTDLIRAWQGHQIEQKWFYVVSGSFLIGIVKPDDWTNPSPNLACKRFVLKNSKPQILHIPAGFANGIRALESNSKMMVFSDKLMEEVTSDNYRYNKDLWFDFNLKENF